MKFISLTDSLYQYVLKSHSNQDDSVLADLRRETQSLGDDARMQISEDQGELLNLLATAIGATSAIEIGVFTGYSSICIARALPGNGRLICLDESEEWTAIARRYWERAKVQSKIDLRLGDALDSLKKLPDGAQFDFAFIDADKTGYDAYYEAILPRVRPGGLIAFDNMLWGGRLVPHSTGSLSEFSSSPGGAAGSHLADSPDGQAIDRLNEKLAHDDRVQCVLLTIADGVQLCRKK